MLHTRSATTGRSSPSGGTIRRRVRSSRAGHGPPDGHDVLKASDMFPGTQVLDLPRPGSLVLLPCSDLQQTCHDLSLTKPKADLRQFA